MLTLHKATDETKAAVKWGAISVSVLILLFFLIKIGINIKESLYPTPLPAPTVSFGKLKAIDFPTTATNKPLTYIVDTLSGTLSAFPDRMIVYKTNENEPNLLDLSQAQNSASRIGFASSGNLVSDTLYQWKEQTYPIRILTLDIVSRNFDLTSDYLSSPSSTLITRRKLNENDAIDAARALFVNMSSFPDDIDETKTKTTLLTINNSQLIPVKNLSAAQIIRVDFFQKDIDKFPIYYSYPSNSAINAFIVGGDSAPYIVEAHYFHQTPINEQTATYPIKTAGEAYDEMMNGKSYIASYNGNNTKIKITNNFLGYLALDKKQEFLMPIIIFEGENGFFAYVSAVRDEWINK